MADEGSARYLWEERFLPMSIKHLGPSLLAAEVVLPLDQVAPYFEKISEWGKRLGVTFYPSSHLINPKQVLFLAMITSDHRNALFYVDLLLIPMMVRLAIQFYGGKPYGLGIWNTPFLRDLYPKEELKQLVEYKKKVDPDGILNAGKFFAVSGKLGPLQKILFHPDLFNLEMASTQWLLLKLFAAIPRRPFGAGSRWFRKGSKTFQRTSIPVLSAEAAWAAALCTVRPKMRRSPPGESC